MDHKQLLGLDVGKARTGVARGSSVARLAEPLTTIESDKLMKKLQELIKQYSVDGIVVGLPRNLDSQDTPQTVWVRNWVTEAKKRIDKPFYWQDEALTSKLAEVQAKTGKHPADVDALAASIILQDFLDTPVAERVVC